jgi:hypothetical protein
MLQLAERAGAGKASSNDLEAGYAQMSSVIRAALENAQLVQRGVECNQATLEDQLAADLAHHAAVAARACLLRSAPVAAGETIFEYGSVVRRRKVHETQSAFLQRAEQLLDAQTAWSLDQQAATIPSHLRELPRPFVVRLQKASDPALRRFACACAADAVDVARTEIDRLGEPMDFEPLLKTIAVAHRHAEGQADSGELQRACGDAEKLSRAWYQRVDDLKYHREDTPGSSRAAAYMAETAACVQACAEPSAKLAGVKCLRLALSWTTPIRSLVDSDAPLYPLLEQFLGPPPPE